MNSTLKAKKEKSRRAGIIIVKNIDQDYFVLGLRIYGSYDLPKGGAEPFETDLVAAMREAEEESGISDLDFKWGLKTTKAKNVTLFIAETSQDPIIRPNPEHGEYEHHDAKWLSFEEASKKLHPYLRPTMEWAKKIIEES